MQVFVCLVGFFFGVFTSHSRNVHSYERVTITGEGLHLLGHVTLIPVADDAGVVQIPITIGIG